MEIQMGIADYIIIAIVAILAGAAVYFAIRHKKRGGGCCGDCSKCVGSCRKIPTEDEK